MAQSFVPTNDLPNTLTKLENRIRLSSRNIRRIIKRIVLNAAIEHRDETQNIVADNLFKTPVSEE